MRNWNPKPRATLFIALVVVLATIPALSFSRESKDITSQENLMSSMRISRFKEKIYAPDFVLKDLEGKNVRLSNLRGKVVLINFWTTWWPWCRKELPSLEKLHKQFHQDPFVLLTIDVGEGEQKVKRFAKKNGLSFPILLDRDSAVAFLCI